MEFRFASRTFAPVGSSILGFVEFKVRYQMSLILKFPQGPIAPVIMALGENEIFSGWVESIEASSARLFVDLQGNPGVEIDGEWYPTFQGIDGQTWSLDHLFGEHFPAIHRSAAFLTIWASFERLITNLCHEIERADGFRISLSDLEGKGINRARKYLVKVADLGGDWAQKGWQEFPHFNSIRNIFAHGDGHVALTQTKLIKYIELSDHMALTDGLLRLGPTFLPFYLSQELELLRGIERSVVQRYGNGT